MNKEQKYTPFSQRNGLSPTPPQLKIGEISDEFRQLIYYYMSLEIDRESRDGFDTVLFNDKWNRVAMDMHVIFLKRDFSDYENSPYILREALNGFFKKGSIGQIFDLLEFFIRHPSCSLQLKQDLSQTFVQSRSAYRVFDSQIIAIGVAEQGEAFERAIADTGANGATAARSHLIEAGSALRDGNWAGSVRESMHAVESVARKLEPNASTLDPALSALERKGYLHGGLRKAFSALYGYSSDQEGIRHAKIFDEEAKVDEADALFMLGACAAFVSYLLNRLSTPAD